MNDKVIIRRSTGNDAEALRRLAELDSCRVPEGDAIVAFVGSELRVAVPVDGGRVLADPFHHTAELIDVLDSYVAAGRPASEGSFRRRRTRPRGALRLA
jgi:hypothetical protein